MDIVKKVGILGASGRMGSLIMKQISNFPNENKEGSNSAKSLLLDIAVCVCDDKDLVGKSVSKITGINISDKVKFSFNKEDLLGVDIIIDFSNFNATGELAKLLLNQKYKGSLLVGTTALSKETYKDLEELSHFAKVGVVSNTTLGLSFLRDLTRQAIRLMPNAEVEIIEYHHSQKVDSPSGTGLSLAKVVAEEKGLDLESSLVYGRHSANAKRSNNEIGLFSIRGGNVSGKHIIHIFNKNESIEIIHNAESRVCFADGAIEIARRLNYCTEPVFVHDSNIVSFLTKD